MPGTGSGKKSPIWWEQIAYKQEGDEKHTLSEPIFVRAPCRCKAKEKIMEIFMRDHRNAIEQKTAESYKTLEEQGPYILKVEGED